MVSPRAAVPTSGLGQWPPIASDVPETPRWLTMRRDGARIVLINAGERPVYLAPPVFVAYEGGAPWVTTSTTPEGVRELLPGGAYSEPAPQRRDNVRVTASVWPDSNPDLSGRSGTEPWFLWIEIAPRKAEPT